MATEMGTVVYVGKKYVNFCQLTSQLSMIYFLLTHVGIFL